MASRSFPGAAIGLALCASTAASAAESAAEYRISLTDVYGSYQGVLARRDACGTAFPQARGVYENAFSNWHARHRKLIDELDQRIGMMIHDASKDQQDYARNIGKYEGAILRQREEVKQALLQQPRAELEVQCRGLPEFLRSAESDLERGFAEQLATVRRRPLARQ